MAAISTRWEGTNQRRSSAAPCPTTTTAWLGWACSVEDRVTRERRHESTPARGHGLERAHAGERESARARKRERRELGEASARRGDAWGAGPWPGGMQSGVYVVRSSLAGQRFDPTGFEAVWVVTTRSPTARTVSERWAGGWPLGALWHVHECSSNECERNCLETRGKVECMTLRLCLSVERSGSIMQCRVLN